MYTRYCNNDFFGAYLFSFSLQYINFKKNKNKKKQNNRHEATINKLFFLLIKPIV